MNIASVERVQSLDQATRVARGAFSDRLLEYPAVGVFPRYGLRIASSKTPGWYFV